MSDWRIGQNPSRSSGPRIGSEASRKIAFQKLGGPNSKKAGPLQPDGFEFVTTIFALVCEYLMRPSYGGIAIMSDHPNPKKKDSSQSSEEIQVPPIPKQTAGAVTGAAIGSVAGPIGAVVGGVVGALAGRAAGRRPIRKTARHVYDSFERRTEATYAEKVPPGIAKNGYTFTGQNCEDKI